MTCDNDTGRLLNWFKSEFEYLWIDKLQLFFLSYFYISYNMTMQRNGVINQTD